MKVKLLGAIAVALLIVLVFAVVAQATVPQSVIDAIIKDAQDGTLDGNWKPAQIRAALDYLKNNPGNTQYHPNLAGVLEDYLASGQGPGTQGGELAFTGGEVLLLLGAGVGLIGGGMILRRSRA